VRIPAAGAETDVIMTAMTCLLLMAPAPPAATLPDLVVNGEFQSGLDNWQLTDDATCASKIVDITLDGKPAKALHLTLKPTAGADPWQITLSQDFDGALPAGHRLRLSYRVRGGQVNGYVEESKDPWTKLVSAPAEAKTEWQTVSAEAVMAKTYDVGTAHLTFHLGFAPAVVELADIGVTDLDAPPAPPGARGTVEAAVPLFVNPDFTDGTKGWQGINARVQATPIPVDIGGFKSGVRLVCNPTADSLLWGERLAQPNAAPIAKGDALYWQVWLRSPDRASMTFCFEQAGPPNTKDIMQTVGLTPEWREFRFLGRAHANFAPGEARGQWFLGQTHGTVEIAGVRFADYGAARGHHFDETIDLWGGRAHDDTWRAAAEARIERLRKGDLSVSVVDADGRPVPGAKVHVEQQRHLFRFGSAVPARMLAEAKGPDADRFRAQVERFYNTVTLENDLKWHDLRPGEQDMIDRALAWCAQRGIQVRGHNLVWGSFQYLAQSVKNLDKNALLAAIDRRVDETVARYRGRCYLWDVVNEAATNTEVWDKVGWENFADVYRRARAADPGALLSYNDYAILSGTPGDRARRAQRVRYLLDHQAPLDVLGIQAHMSTPLVPMDSALKILDEWAAFGKRLEITEFDLGCADDKAHGEYVRDILTAAFSHPSVDGFIMWGFWAGAHWRAKEHGEMIESDWTPRPAELAWEDLVKRQWWTKWDGVSDGTGQAKLRAFLGKHEVTVSEGGMVVKATVDLAAGGGTVTVKLP
jgi:GH35 family endo-1,4-beta-xylanase